METLKICPDCEIEMADNEVQFCEHNHVLAYKMNFPGLGQRIITEPCESLEQAKDNVAEIAAACLDLRLEAQDSKKH